MGCLKLTYGQGEGVGENASFNLWEVYRKGESEEKKGVEYYRYGFQGQFSIEDSGISHNNFTLRSFDPVTGRWVTPDIYGQYWSPYLGMGNNPIYTTDPDGGFGVVGAVIGGVIGAGFSIAGQVADGTFDWRSGESWGRVTLAAGTGALAGSGVGLLAGAGLAAAGEFGDQLIVNGGDVSKTNVTNILLAGGGAFVGGAIANKLVHSGFFKNEIVTRIRVSSLDFKAATGNTITNLSHRQISSQIINNIFGEGFSAFAGGQLTNISKDLVKRFINDMNQQSQINFMNHLNILNTINQPTSGPSIIIEPLQFGEKFD